MTTETPRQGQVLRRYDRGTRPRDVTPTIDGGDEFERQRELAEQYACDPGPLGCGVDAGERCRVIGRPDLYLTRRPAHLGRLRRAGVAPPSTVGTGERRDYDRPEDAPIPEQNRHLYDQP
jgi:hypothetical protein